jgi:hypothetical protein
MAVLITEDSIFHPQLNRHKKELRLFTAEKSNRSAKQPLKLPSPRTTDDFQSIYV